MKLPKREPFPYLIILLIASLLANFFFIFKNIFPFSARPSKTSRQTVVRILDGDTFDTKEGSRIRIALTDAPEYSKDCLALESKQRLSDLILGKEVLVQELAKDNLGRNISLVSVDGLEVNKALVSEGLAKFRDDNKLTDYSMGYDEAQNEAIAARRGIWSAKCRNVQKEGCLIKGNYRADRDTKIYHLPDCYNYDKITVNLKEKDQWFCTEEEAKLAGFTKSLDCP